MNIHGPDYLTSPTKRHLDLLGGTALALTLLPAIASTAVVSAFDTKNLNPFITQRRVGIHGSALDIVKIRTLRDPKVDDPIMTYGTFDPRASKIGSKIRQYGLDEMPQIANVINGDMSLVGIRPLLDVDFDRMLDADHMLFDEWLSVYLSYKTALTGPGQLYRRYHRVCNDKVYAHSMRLDLQYIESASLLGDIKILAQTPISMISANLHTVDNS